MSVDTVQVYPFTSPVSCKPLIYGDNFKPLKFYLRQLSNLFCNCPGSPFAGVNSTCTGRKTMDFQHLNGALAYHYRAKRAYFGQYRDGFSISLAIDLSSKGLPGQLLSL